MDKVYLNSTKKVYVEGDEVYSYNTLVAYKERELLIILPGNWSNTTKRHISLANKHFGYLKVIWK